MECKSKDNFLSDRKDCFTSGEKDHNQKFLLSSREALVQMDFENDFDEQSSEKTSSMQNFKKHCRSDSIPLSQDWNNFNINNDLNCLIVKPKIDVYNNAQKILQSQHERFKDISKPYFTVNYFKTRSAEEGIYVQKEVDPTSSSQMQSPPQVRSKLQIFTQVETIMEKEEEEETQLNSDCAPHLPNCEYFLSKEQIGKEQIRIFLYRPIEAEVWIKGKIERKVEKKFTFFFFYLNDNDRFLISAIKKSRKKYNFSASQNPTYEKDDDYLGCLKSNFFGTEFQLYGEGKKPKKRVKEKLRANLCGITYEANLFGLKGPRKMKVYVPKISNDGKACKEIIPSTGNDTILRLFQKKLRGSEDIEIFINKPPLFSRKYKCYVLDYKDRSIRSSVKNFQLVREPYTVHGEEISLQFGRTGENSFIVDFTYPFSSFQAFAIGLSSIDNKIACE